MVDARYANGVAVSWRNAPGERGVTDRLVQNPETRLEMSVAGHHASRKYGVR
jgi:hypothetical protein